LASSLGVSEPVLYQHFRTKQDLYRAIIELKAAEVSEHAAELKQLALGEDDRRFFTRLGELILERYEADPELFRIVYFSCLERHELSDLFFEHLFANFYKMVAGYIRRRIRAGAFRAVNAEMAARGAIGMMSYHGLVRLLFPGKLRKPDRRRVVMEMVAIFLGGIAAQRPEEPKPPAPRRDSAKSPSTHSTAS
jgi:AcrR family transcriptional regulator